MFNMFALTGPPKVEGVVFGNSMVKNGKIYQEIKWNLPVLSYNVIPQYVIRYGVTQRDFINKSQRTFSSESNATLRLHFSTSNITYYIAVAVRSSQGQRRGDYSDPVSITYTSEYIYVYMCIVLELREKVCL